jgi:hypothetical protein
MRILSADSPLFNPQGYHYGSVWPLYTGWTALAEYHYGRPVQGFTHLMNNMMIKRHWAKGFVEEVMNGIAYAPAGVCPHQCWSETNILHPGIEGLIGWKPSAPENTAELTPRFPAHWDSVKVRHLRIGKLDLSLDFFRSNHRTIYVLKLESGPACRIKLTPQWPEGMMIDHATVNDRIVSYSSGEALMLSVKNPVKAVFRHRKGVEMVPSIPQPMPGDASLGYRIVDAQLESNIYTVELEGKSGTSQNFTVRIFDGTVKTWEGAEPVLTDRSGCITFRVAFPSAHQPFSRKTVRMMLQP